MCRGACCGRCRACVHRVAPVVRALSLLGGLLMLVGGVLGGISWNPFVIIQAFFLAVLGLAVIGAECSWVWLLRRANFLSSYTGKGFFFMYIAIPLLEEGFNEYKGCVMLWVRGCAPLRFLLRHCLPQAPLFPRRRLLHLRPIGRCFCPKTLKYEPLWRENVVNKSGQTIRNTQYSSD